MSNGNPGEGILTREHLDEFYGALMRVAELPPRAYEAAPRTAVIIPGETTSTGVLLAHTVFTGDAQDFLHTYTVAGQYGHHTLREISTLGRLAMRGVAPLGMTESQILEDSYPRFLFHFKLSAIDQRDLESKRPRTADADLLLEASKHEWAEVDAILTPHGR